MITSLAAISPAALGGLLETATAVVFWLAKALLLGSCAALLAWLLVTRLLRGARPAIITAFWVVVLLRFIAPEMPGLPLSLSSLVAQFSPAFHRGEIPPSDVAAVQNETGCSAYYFVVEGQSAAPLALAPLAAAPQPGMKSWAAGIALAYILSVTSLLIVRLWAYRRFAARMRALPPADPAVTSLVNEVCRLSGVTRRPRVHIQPEGGNAFVFGLIRPTLVISHEHLAAPDELRAVVLHEAAHLRRGDLLVRFLQWLVGTLLFFWPVVAWVNRRIDLAREHACDEWALRHGALTPAQYARCLLRAARGNTLSRGAFTPAAMASNSNHVERRIEMIFQSSRMRASRWLGVTSGVALLAWGGFVLSGASAMVAKSAKAARTAAGHAVSIVQDGETATCEKRVMVCTVTSDGGEPRALACDGKAGVWVAKCDTTADGAETRKCVVRVCNEMDAESLANFRSAHPTADANADGTLTMAEHNAFLAALALRDGAAVIGQFPKADLNTNGQLDTDEAVRLAALGLPFDIKLDVANGGPHAMAFIADEDSAGPGQPMRIVKRIVSASPEAANGELKIAVATEDGAPGEMHVVARCITANGANPGEAPVEVTVNGEKIEVPGDVEETVTQDGNRKIVVRRVMRASDAEGNPLPADALKEIKLAIPAIGQWVGAGEFPMPMMSAGPQPVAQWLLDNISATPTEEEVAGLVGRIERLPLDMFLKDHPAADTNQDGSLTPSERDAFLQTLIGDAQITINGEELSGIPAGAKVMVATTDGGNFEGHCAELLKAFPEADTNNDGTLSREELDAHIQSMISTQGAADPSNPNRRMIFIKRDGVVLNGSAMECDGRREVEVRVEAGSGSPKQ
ncbi:MAG: M48 family metalloprotease [Phycisphaerales bacterium]|nr:M48 family metalloprotease [Phycisphaerales bacterium]